MAELLKRRGVRVALIVVALVVLAIALVPLLVPAGKVRDLVVERVRSATGADVAFGGASVRLLPRVTVAVADGRISGTGEALARATGQPSDLVRYQVSLDRVEVSLALGPLLRRRVEIGRVRLVRPQIEVVTRPPATTSTAGGAGATPAPAAPSPAFALAVAALEARDGTLTWREEGTGRSVKAEGWQQTLTAGDLTALSQRLGALSKPGAAAATGRGETSLGLSTRVARLTLEGFGKVTPLRLGDLACEARATLPAAGDLLRVAVTRLSWGRLALTADATVAAAAGGRRLAGTWKLDEAQLPALLDDLLPLAPPVPGPAGAWLAGKPVTAGRLTAAGGFDLPWPLPQPAAPDLLLRGLTAEGRLAGGSVKLPDGKSAVTVETAFALRDGALMLTGLQARNGEVLQLGGEATLPLPPLGGRLKADLKGTLDLAAAASLLALIPDPKPAPGRPAPTISWHSYRLVGKVDLAAVADLADAPPLDQPLAWQQRLQGPGLAGVRVSATAAGFSAQGPGLTPALRVQTVAVTSDLRTATVKLAGAEHPVLAGGGEIRLTRLQPVPRAEIELRLTRFDADKLTEMTATPAAAAAPHASLAAPAGELSPLLAWAVGTALAAAPSAAAAVPPGEALPPGLTATCHATAEQMTLGKLSYEQVAVTGTLADRVFTVPAASARLGGGTIDGSARVDYAADPWGRLDFKAKVANVPAATLLSPYAKGAASIWEGKVGGDVGGGCRIRDPQAVMKSLSLEGLAVSTDGVIHGSQFLQGIDQYLGARKDLKEIRFKDFTHHLAVKDGRYTISDLALRGLDTDWRGEGWISFDGGIDLNLVVKLPAGFRPEAGSLTPLLDTLRGDDGRIALALRLSGQAAKPAVALDLSGAKAKARQDVQNEVKRGVDRLLDKLKRK